MTQASAVANLTLIAEPRNCRAPKDVRFRLEEDKNDNPKFLYGQDIDLERAEWDGRVTIKLTLNNTTDLNLRFPKKAKDAIWISAGAVSPQAPGDAAGMFTLNGVDQTRKTLTITNHNFDEGLFKYTLKLEPHGVEWDPVIINKGGGTRPTSPPLPIVAAALIAGAALVAAALFAAWRLGWF